MNKYQKYVVHLSEEERVELTRLVGGQRGTPWAIRRARVLLKSDAGWSDERIVAALGVASMTVHNVRKQYVHDGVARTLKRKPVYGRQPVLDRAAKAQLIALSCGEPPEGRKHWTLRLLARQMVELGYVEAVSHETIRQVLKKPPSNRD